ncbi:hypothetical protein C8R47DRAFT_1083523 [Mycena vitilis]|nr:hypothetical protein C8R47DRAFT_1083523 [Mycena vitilis]
MAGKRREAQCDAEARYRDKNAEELRRKARERMARRRARLCQSEEAVAQRREQARAHSARFRAEHGPELRRKARQRRAKVSIAKIGYDSWFEGYRRRNPLDPDIDAEVDHSDLDHPPDPDPDLVVTPPEPEPEPARIERVRDRYIDYQSKINEWLDTCDPTTAPDYVPKPGERPYFQRGKKRWY